MVCPTTLAAPSPKVLSSIAASSQQWHDKQSVGTVYTRAAKPVCTGQKGENYE